MDWLQVNSSYKIILAVKIVFTVERREVGMGRLGGHAVQLR